MKNNNKKIKLLMQNRDPLKWPGGDSIMVEELSNHLNKLPRIKSVLNYELYPKLHNIDIVMSWNMNFSWAFHHLINAKLNNKPFILFTMNFSIGDKIQQKILIEHSDYLVMFSKKEKDSIENFLNIKINNDKILYFRQAVSKKFITTYNSDGRKGVICSARIEERKNQLMLIKACNQLKIPLLLAGKPHDEQYYEQCLKEAKKSNHLIKFLGHLSHDELKEIYKKCKVVALISEFEPWGLSHLEAALCGCNIVTTTKSYSDDSKTLPNCWTCDPNNLQEITNIIKKAYSTKFDKNLQNKITKLYSWEKRASELENIIKSVLKTKKSNNSKEMQLVLIEQIQSYERKYKEIQDKSNLIEKELRIKQDILNEIYDSKFYRLWGIYNRFKNVFINETS